KLTIHLVMPAGEKLVSRVNIGLYDESWSKGPTTMRLCALPVDTNGVATIAIEPGAFRKLVLEHDDYFVTPDFEPGGWKKHLLRIEPGENDELWFQLRRKVTARGRVINSETGRPLPDAWVSGEILNEVVAGKSPVPPEKWVNSDGTNTDRNGEYTLAFVAGSARVMFSENNFVADADYVQFTVAADGSTVIPDIQVRRMPKIVGTVENADGTPVSNAVVRIRGKYLRWMQPALTDAAGRFELQPPWVPIDEKDQLQPMQPLVAFDPRRPLAARADVRVGQPGETLLKLEPHEPAWLLTAFAEEMSEWERGQVPKEQAEKDASISWRGKPAPELEGVAWLSVDRPAAKLSEFRGKYVLLDFWFTACGPCHREFPAVKLIHELYRDQVVVIGVHNNSALPNAVAEHVARIGLPFPVVVDHSDGRLIARYQQHGLVPHYPSYVLIGPDGTVLLDDVTIPNPKLLYYKLEILHQYLHGTK
ncbi:MAG: redoxin domain-containing protein, partial [Deltaproteobacteria bacterium]